MVRSIFALQAIYKPQLYMHRYHIMRMSTWIVFVILQIFALFFNFFFIQYAMYGNLALTAGIQAIVLFVSGTIDAFGCYVVSCELINTLKKQR